jgi:hypothetical protein
MTIRPPAAALLLALVLVAACASDRAQADQDRDAAIVAGALRTAALDGSGFALDHQLQLSAGGQSARFHGVVTSGVLKGSSAQFGYRLDQAQQGGARYDMLVAAGLLYVRRQGGTSWKATPLSGATMLFPALRLDLLRETVLLAASISAGSLGHIDSGFVRRYAVRPAPDQLEELQSVTLDQSAAQAFLGTASGEVDVFMTVPGDRLARVEVHLSGLDPSTGQRQDIASTLTLRAARAGAIQAPADAQQVAAGDVLT